MNWFDVDKNGLAQLLERKGKEFVLLELLQNAWDENCTKVTVELTRVPNSRYVRLVVEDDSPDGFTDLSHAFTLFAASRKKGDAQKRGRFNLGEKLVLALCEEASIASTKGTVVFDESGRSIRRTKRQAGSEFDGLLRMTAEEMQRCLDVAKTLLAPHDITTVINGHVLQARSPVADFNATLTTEIANEDGFMVRTQRKTRIEIYEPLPGEVPQIYEMGIPVVETGDRWHLNVWQKVPLNFDRDNVPPSFLDGSCQKAVNGWAAQRAADGLSPCSVRTGGYCRARQRLPLEMVSALTRETGRVLNRKALAQWLWRGRAVKLVDGTGLSMPDTQENQARYPQPSTQAPGVGFPAARLVMVICLATGAALDAAIGPHRGKGSGELALVRGLLGGFSPGDVMLADALYCNYFLIATLMAAGVDVLFEQNGSRITDLSVRPVVGYARTPCALAQAGPSRVDDARAVCTLAR